MGPTCPAFLPVYRQGQLEEIFMGRHHSPRLPQKRVIWRLTVYEGCWEPECGLSGAKLGFEPRTSESLWVFKSGSMLVSE